MGYCLKIFSRLAAAASGRQLRYRYLLLLQLNFGCLFIVCVLLFVLSYLEKKREKMVS